MEASRDGREEKAKKKARQAKGIERMLTSNENTKRKQIKMLHKQYLLMKSYLI
jgi:hypothetical protein